MLPYPFKNFEINRYFQKELFKERPVNFAFHRNNLFNPKKARLFEGSLYLTPHSCFKQNLSNINITLYIC